MCAACQRLRRFVVLPNLLLTNDKGAKMGWPQTEPHCQSGNSLNTAMPFPPPRPFWPDSQGYLPKSEWQTLGLGLCLGLDLPPGLSLLLCRNLCIAVDLLGSVSFPPPKHRDPLCSCRLPCPVVLLIRFDLAGMPLSWPTVCVGAALCIRSWPAPGMCAR